MIRLEIFEEDGTPVITTEWHDTEARQMGAYRMRYLSPSARHINRWARTTDRYGKVTTQGQVPPEHQAGRGRYVIHTWREDGHYSSAEPFRVMPASTSANRAEDYRRRAPHGGQR